MLASIRIPRMCALLVLLLSLVSTSTLHAQRYLGAIQGEVTDPTGAKVPGATVTVVEVGTDFKRTGKTNDLGVYSFPALNPGTYVVTTLATGFRAEKTKNVVLTGGQLKQVDVNLLVGNTSESVDVVAENSMMDAGSANIATTLSTKDTTDLPNIGRNPFVLATLAAGVINTGSGGYFQGKASTFTNPFSGTAVQLTTDGSGGHNRLTLDGIPDDPAERFSGAGYTGFVPSPEAVQEVKVQTSIFDAQVGHGNGTVTNTIIRNGSNKVHGAAYYVFQNTYLNANNYEKVPNQNAAVKPTPRNNDQLSQTGFVFDGPVYIPKVYDGHDKSFFMVSYERYASHAAQNYSARVPTAAERAGDFSALCSAFNSAGFCTSGVQLYMPNSPVDASGNRTSYFANNNIASAISPAGAALVNYLPLPNVPGAPITSPTNYISTQTSYQSTYPSFIARFDQTVTKGNSLNAIFFRSGLTQNFPLQGFPKGIAPNGYGYHVYRNNRGGSLDDVQIISPSLVLDSRFGLLYHPFGLVYPENVGFDLSSIGLASAGLPYASFPGESSSDSYASLAPGAGGQVSEDTTGSLSEILTKAAGTHSIRIGFEGNIIRYNVQNPESGFGSGSGTPGFTFDRRFTQQNSVNTAVGSDAKSGDPIASMLLGAFSTATYNISPAYALQQIYIAPFVQDDWRATNKLTLNLGVRWDYESPFTERYNKQVSNFCTTCTNPLQSSVPSLTLNGGLQYTSPSDRLPYPRDLNNFQPRIGAAYEASPGTIARAGFGIIYFNTLETPVGTGFSQSTSYNNYTTSAPLNPLSNAFPAGAVLPTGNSLGLSTALGQNIAFIDPHHVQPKTAQYSASVQHQFGGDYVLQIAYVGTRPTRLEVNHNINVLPQQYYNLGAGEVAYLNAKVPNPFAGKLPQAPGLNGATIARNLLLLPYPEFGSVTEEYSSIGSAPYNSLQVQVSKRLSKHYSLKGNFTWDKVMLHTSFLNPYDTHLASIQDGSATLFGNIWGILELPKFASKPAYERLPFGGWQLNSVLRASNGNLISAPTLNSSTPAGVTPPNINIIGNPRQPNATYARYFNTCYEDTSGNPVLTSQTGAPACDALSPTPAYQERLQYTSQTNSTVLNIRQRIHPLLDASLFKQFVVREGVSLEIRGEFFNVLNTPNFGGPNTSIAGANFGIVSLTQANDPRIGQLTGRINF